MTNLIKVAKDGSAESRIRSVPQARQALRGAEQTQLQQDARETYLKQEIVRLERELKDRDIRIERHDAELKRAFEDGEANGFKAGLAAAEERHAERLSGLETGIERALKLFAARLTTLDHLAANLAIEGLEKVLGNASYYGDLIEAAIRTQLQSLNDQTIIGVEVSRDDFTERSDLEALCSRIANPQLSLTTSEDLKTGECRIKLTLGGLDIGVSQQWERLKDGLLDISTPSDAWPEAAE